MWVAPEAALRKPTTGLGGVLSLVVSLRRASFDKNVLRLGMPFFSLVIAGHPNPPHERAELVESMSAKDCHLHSILVDDCLKSPPFNLVSQTAAADPRVQPN